jgi:diphthine-ammonia ligase
MKVACLFSGGKDSTYAAYLAQKQGHTISYLVSVFPESSESYMFHYPKIEVTVKQAKAMGIEHIIVKTRGEKEKELVDLREALQKLDIKGVVSGAVMSDYQKTRIDAIALELNLSSFAPLWHKDEEALLMGMINDGFEIEIVSVSADGLDESWVGRTIDEKAVAELKEIKKKYGINISGEGGEYETIVLNCPLFSHSVDVD